MLRMYVDSSKQPETANATQRLLWLYLPDFMNGGEMSSIEYIPAVGYTYADIEQQRALNGKLPDEMIYWKQDDSCAGFSVSKTCNLRYEEMQLITFTPSFCHSHENKLKGCEFLVSYARIDINSISRKDAIFNFAKTLFTIVFLSGIFIIFNRDTEIVVVKPIKKVVQIIIRLAENPLKKPEPPKDEEESGS